MLLMVIWLVRRWNQGNWRLKIQIMCLLHLFRGVGRALTTSIIAEFLEPFYGLYWCMSRAKEGRFWGEADAPYLSIGNNEVKVGDGGVCSCWWTAVAGWYFLVVPVWKSIGDGLTREIELVELAARAGTWWSESRHGRRMGYLPWLISCRLLRLILEARGKHLTSHFSWIAAWLLVTRVRSVYLVNELVLVFFTPYDWDNGGSADTFLHKGCYEYSHCSPLLQYGRQKLRNFCRGYVRIQVLEWWIWL